MYIKYLIVKKWIKVNVSKGQKSGIITKLKLCFKFDDSNYRSIKPSSTFHGQCQIFEGLFMIPRPRFRL